MVDVLHHVPPGEQQSFFLKACQRVTTGGLLVYKDMCARPRALAAANQLHDLIFARQWIHHVAVERVAGWAAEAGMTLLEQENERRFWYGHELRVFQAAAQ
jgi:hypothetical protein